MIELLSYALVLSGNYIFTSAGHPKGTNMAVIRGALRAGNPDLLTVILPQSLSYQDDEIQDTLKKVVNLVEQPKFDDLDLKDAANLCNAKIRSMKFWFLPFTQQNTYQRSYDVVSCCKVSKCHFQCSIRYIYSANYIERLTCFL